MLMVVEALQDVATRKLTLNLRNSFIAYGLRTGWVKVAGCERAECPLRQ